MRSKVIPLESDPLRAIQRTIWKVIRNLIQGLQNSWKIWKLHFPHLPLTEYSMYELEHKIDCIRLDGIMLERTCIGVDVKHNADDMGEM